MRRTLTLSYALVLVIALLLSAFTGCSCDKTPKLPDIDVSATDVSVTDLSPTDVTPTDVVVEEELAEPFVTLVRGDKGDRVAEVQERLIELGFLNDVADGSFGGRTKKAVDAFQKVAGLTVSGEVDEATYTALMSENAPTAKSGQNTATTTTTKKKTDSTSSSKKTTTTEKKDTTTKKTTTTAKATTTTKKTTTTTKASTTTKKTTTTTKATTTAKTTTTTKASTTTAKTTTTTKATTTTTTTKAPTTTTTTTTTTKKTTTTTTTTAASRWVSESAMSSIKSELKSYAASIGMTWDSSLDADNAMWGSATRVYTTGYSKSEYISRMKGKIEYYQNKGYEYVNVKITSHTNGEYLMTCYFG